MPEALKPFLISTILKTPTYQTYHDYFQTATHSYKNALLNFVPDSDPYQSVESLTYQLNRIQWLHQITTAYFLHHPFDTTRYHLDNGMWYLNDAHELFYDVYQALPKKLKIQLVNQMTIQTATHDHRSFDALINTNPQRPNNRLITQTKSEIIKNYQIWPHVFGEAMTKWLTANRLSDYLNDPQFLYNQTPDKALMAIDGGSMGRWMLADLQVLATVLVQISCDYYYQTLVTTTEKILFHQDLTLLFEQNILDIVGMAEFYNDHQINTNQPRYRFDHDKVNFGQDVIINFADHIQSNILDQRRWH